MTTLCFDEHLFPPPQSFQGQQGTFAQVGPLPAHHSHSRSWLSFMECRGDKWSVMYTSGAIEQPKAKAMAILQRPQNASGALQGLLCFAG